MPPVTVKWEGSGNGKRSLPSNVADVAKACQWESPLWILKWWSLHLGRPMQESTASSISTQTSAAPASASSSHYQVYLQGHVEAQTLQSSFQLLLERTVLCPQCHLPEMSWRLSKQRTYIKQTCRSCGAKRSFRSKTLEADKSHVRKWIQYVTKDMQRRAGASISTEDKKKRTSASSKTKQAPEDDADVLESLANPLSRALASFRSSVATKQA